MSDRPGPWSDPELHAYVDGQLDPEQSVRFEARMAAEPELARFGAAYSRQNATFHAAYDASLREPVPAALRRPPPPFRLRLLRRLAAALALVACGGAGGWWLAAGFSPSSAVVRGLAERAAVAHAVYAPEIRHPVEVAASEHDHLATWLSKRLGSSVAIPHLDDVGFRLVGGRLLPDAQGPAAQFMYEEAQGRRLTLYLRVSDPAAGESAFRWTDQKGVTICYWTDGGFAYALAGDLARPEMQRVAEAVHRQIQG